MFSLILLIVQMVGIFLGFFALFLVLFPFLARALARHNAFFTFIEEGTFKDFLHNKAFKRGVLRYQGFFTDKKWNIRQGQEKEETSHKRLWQKYWDRFMAGGLVWVGIWPFDAVHTYEFRWVAPKGDKDEPHKEILDYAFAKAAIYTVEIKGIETKGMVPLNIKLRLTIRLVNMYKPQFRCHQWLEFVVSRLGPYVREFVPSEGLEFDEFIKMKQLPGGPLFEFLRGKGELTDAEQQFYRDDGYSDSAIESLKKSGGGILAIFREAYGIAVEGIEFASIDSVEGKYEEAAAKKWSAEREEERIMITARAEAGAIETVAQAIEKHGQIGVLTKTLETIKDASNKPGNWIFSVDWLRDVVGGVLGKKKGGNTQ